MSRIKRKRTLSYLHNKTAATTGAPRDGIVAAKTRKAALRSEILGLVPMKNTVLRDAARLYSHISLLLP